MGRRHRYIEKLKRKKAYNKRRKNRLREIVATAQSKRK